MGISVVIPVYNSERSIPDLLREVGGVMSGLGVPFEAILVNDGSRDGSWGAIAGAAASLPWLRGINLMRNYGQHNALLCGIRAARHDIVVTLDDDLQNPPSEIPLLLAKLAEGCDVVYGVPDKVRQSFLRRAASRITRQVLQGAMGAEAASRVSAFRAFRTKLRDAFAAYQSPFVSVDVLLTWATTRFEAVTVRHEPRRYGASTYTLGMLVRHGVNLLTGFSTFPLQLASVTGFFFTLFGFGVLVFVVGRYLLNGSSVPGFPFLASIIAIFSGAQMFALGIIGEYLVRMHFRSMEKPPYAVRDRTHPD